jgi:plastocyanin
VLLGTLIAALLGAACAVPGLSSPSGPAAVPAGQPESVQVLNVIPTETPFPVQEAPTPPTGPVPTALTVDRTPVAPDLPKLSPPPTATLISSAAAAATANAATVTASIANAAATATALPMQDIRIQDFAFSPPTLTIPPGTTVRWVNLDPSVHQVTGPDFDSGRMPRGQSWAAKMEKQGKFDYICSIHPTMKAQIVVTEPSVAERFSS